MVLSTVFGDLTIAGGLVEAVGRTSGAGKADAGRTGLDLVVTAASANGGAARRSADGGRSVVSLGVVVVVVLADLLHGYLPKMLMNNCPNKRHNSLRSEVAQKDEVEYSQNIFVVKTNLVALPVFPFVEPHVMRRKRYCQPRLNHKIAFALDIARIKVVRVGKFHDNDAENVFVRHGFWGEEFGPAAK